MGGWVGGWVGGKAPSSFIHSFIHSSIHPPTHLPTYPNHPRSPPCLREGHSLSTIASSPKSAPFSSTANKASASASVFT